MYTLEKKIRRSNNKVWWSGTNNILTLRIRWKLPLDDSKKEKRVKSSVFKLCNLNYKPFERTTEDDKNIKSKSKK